MKKLVFLMILILSSFSYSFDLKIKSELPKEIEKSIYSAVSSFSGSEKREYFDWYKEAYLEIEKRLDDAKIPKEDRNYITKKIRAMYGNNFPKQLTVIGEEIAEYQNLVNRIKQEKIEIMKKKKAEDTKSKLEIEEILSEESIPTSFKESIRIEAKKEFSDNYSLQKAYIKGATQTYLKINKMVRK